MGNGVFDSHALPPIWCAKRSLIDVASGDGAQVVAKRVPVDGRIGVFNFLVSAPPGGKSAGEQIPSLCGENEDAPATV